MVANHPPKVTRKGTIFPRINAAARALKIHRITLYRVLKGHYPDRGNYTQRYFRWLKRQQQGRAA